MNCGADQAFTITADAGYLGARRVGGRRFGGRGGGATRSRTCTANHTIAATFASTVYTITATAGAGGTIAPSGAVLVNDGADQAFTITANAGFAIARRAGGRRLGGCGRDVHVHERAGEPHDRRLVRGGPVHAERDDQSATARWRSVRTRRPTTRAPSCSSRRPRPPAGTSTAGAVTSSATRTRSPSLMDGEQEHHGDVPAEHLHLEPDRLGVVHGGHELDADALARVDRRRAAVQQRRRRRRRPDVPTQTIAQLLVSGNTQVTFRGTPGHDVTADSGGSGVDLDVAAGSSLARRARTRFASLLRRARRERSAARSATSGGPRAHCPGRRLAGVPSGSLVVTAGTGFAGQPVRGTTKALNTVRVPGRRRSTRRPRAPTRSARQRPTRS